MPILTDTVSKAGMMRHLDQRKHRMQRPREEPMENSVMTSSLLVLDIGQEEGMVVGTGGASSVSKDPNHW